MSKVFVGIKLCLLFMISITLYITASVTHVPVQKKKKKKNVALFLRTTHLEPVVRKPINANPGLKQPCILFLLLEKFSKVIFKLHVETGQSRN